MNVTITHHPEQSWWSRIPRQELTVTATYDRHGNVDPIEWRITDGEHEGKLILRSCCSIPEVKEEVA